MTSNSEASTADQASRPHLVDIGANLCAEAFRHDQAHVIERAFAAGVGTIIVTGSSVPDSENAERLSRRYASALFATAGIHPHLAREWDAESYRRLRALAATPNVVAIGETGLDFNRDFSPRATQEAVFEAHLELAAEVGLPLFVHERDAHERLLALLGPVRKSIKRAVVHCFTGTAAELEVYLGLDLYIGVTGWICDERRGQHLRELVRQVPRNRLMIETDAPYLLPRDLRPKPRTRRNEPCHLPHILRTVAECREEDPWVLARVTTENARRFFALPDLAAGPDRSVPSSTAGRTEPEPEPAGRGCGERA